MQTTLLTVLCYQLVHSFIYSLKHLWELGRWIKQKHYFEIYLFFNYLWSFVKYCLTNNSSISNRGIQSCISSLNVTKLKGILVADWLLNATDTQWSGSSKTSWNFQSNLSPLTESSVSSTIWPSWRDFVLILKLISCKLIVIPTPTALT